MGQGIHRLTDREVITAKPKRCSKADSPNYGKPVDTVYSDGGGLYLRVMADGSKNWVYRYMASGKSHNMGFGSAHTLSLAEARERARQQRVLKLGGVDPIIARREAVIAEAVRAAQVVERKTFGDDATAYIASKERKWKDRAEAGKWRSMLRTHAASIWDMPVGSVETPQALAILQPLLHARYKLMRVLQYRIEAVLDYATVMGHRKGDNPARWKGFLDKVLIGTALDAEVEHRAALAWREVPALITDLRGMANVKARAMEFLILTATRAGEVVESQRNVGMKWPEVDFDTATWTIPGARMKGNRPHRVPLSDRAIAILREMQQQPGDRVFAIGYDSLKKELAKQRPGVTLHGFRSAFRDWAKETNVADDLADRSLAHYPGDKSGTDAKTVQAYLRTDLLDQRRPVMDDWAGFCGEAAPATKIAA